MQYIYQILEKFLALFKSRSNTNSDNKSSNGSICFNIGNNEDINIEYNFPNLTHATNADIVTLSEKYANVLTSISLGELNDLLYEKLKVDTNDDSKNYSVNELLFFNNVISFWTLLYKEKKYIKIKTLEQQLFPVVRPSQVFKAS
jgi:hypothetical protein